MPSSPREPLLTLPGFAPDALGFASRTTLSLLIAYLFSFYVQLDSASTAGVCVAIVAQPSSGQALSKATYRLIGTVLGGIVALVFTAIFGQDRTMLLVVFALWLGLCTAVASLLKDFRAYGAVLCGYTVGIISISDIDVPQNAFGSAVNRVAAIVVGIVAVALVNVAFAPRGAWEGLCERLRAAVEAMTRQAARVLRGEAALDSEASLTLVGELLLLRTEASYAAAELPDGGLRADGARSAIAALFGMLSAARAIQAALQWQPSVPPARLGLTERAAVLEQGEAPPPLPLPGAATLHDAFMADRLNDLLAQHRLAQSGLDTLVSGAPLARRVHLRVYHDWVGAGLNATRAMLGVGLGAVFCIYSGWSGSTSMLVQLAAFVALLGLAPNPSRAAWGAMLSLPGPILLAGLVEFLALPLVSGPVPFCIAVGSCCFVLSLLVRLPAAASVNTTLLLYFCLVLAPANPQTYDLAGFLNLSAAQVLAVLFLMLSFWLILPVQPNRRLLRVADAIGRELARRLNNPAPRRQRGQAAVQSLHYDRLAAAQLWLGRRTLSRRRLLARLQALSEIDTALWRAETGLDAAARVPALRSLVERARRSLDQPERGEMEAAAAALLAAGLAVAPQPADLQPMLLHAVSGLYGAAQVLEAERSILRKSGILRSGSGGPARPDPKVPEAADVA